MDGEEKTGYKIRGHHFSFVLFSIALLTSILTAYRLHWLCDDAFITFRYSYNLHKGIGPIYNLGEEVEGYTNFLWMILISTGLNFNISPERSSQALGLLSYILNLVLLFLAGNKIHETKYGKDRIYLPLSMICFSIQYHARVYATSGLETSFFTFLLLSGNLIIYFYIDQVKLWIGFTLLTLLCMTRPDGLLFYGFSSVFFLFFRCQNLNYKEIFLKNLYIHLPFLLIYIPYFYWRYQFYGYIFPNTFYAKEAGSIYILQGIKYIFLYFNTYYVFYILLLLLIIYFLNHYFFDIKGVIDFFIKRTNKDGWLSKRKYRNFFGNKIEYDYDISENKFINMELEWFFLALIPSLVYISYLCIIGGDFMFARLLIPLSPLLFLGIELFLYPFFNEKIIRYAGIIIILATFFYINPYKKGKVPEVYNITDENKIYNIKEIYKLKLKLLPLRKIFMEDGIKISYGGTQAMIAYYLDPLVAIETVSGLTDSTIAHKKINIRGRVGHEKSADIEYLKKRKIHFHLFETNFSFVRSYNKLEFESMTTPWRIITYNQKILDDLEKTGKFKFTNFDEYLNSYIKKIDSIKKEEFTKDYNEFNDYYFIQNKNREKQAIFLGKIDSIKNIQELGNTNE